MKLKAPLPAIDFVGTTLSNKSIQLANYKGERILLSFFRNGACAMCNLRVHELIRHYADFEKNGIRILGVFESSREDMLPYVGQQNLPFELIADPEANLYELYHLESSQEKIEKVISSGVAEERIKEAAAQGYHLTKQAGANFYRLPADFLIDENFNIVKLHYSDIVIDHMNIADIINYFNP